MTLDQHLEKLRAHKIYYSTKAQRLKNDDPELACFYSAIVSELLKAIVILERRKLRESLR